MTMEEEKLFEQYQKVTGGEDPIGLIIPSGYPRGVKEMGGPAAVYKECIRRKITWEELLGYNPPEDVYL